MSDYNTYSSILLRFSLLNSGVSKADDGRNISVDDGAVCGRCNKFIGTGSMFELVKDVYRFSAASVNCIGMKVLSIC